VIDEREARRSGLHPELLAFAAHHCLEPRPLAVARTRPFSLPSSAQFGMYLVIGPEGVEFFLLVAPNQI
jgi:hypothetical protein